MNIPILKNYVPYWTYSIVILFALNIKSGNSNSAGVGSEPSIVFSETNENSNNNNNYYRENHVGFGNKCRPSPSSREPPTQSEVRDQHHCPPVMQVGNSYRALVFDAHTCHCYPIYSRGPCAANQWLVVKQGKYECDFNPCFTINYHSHGTNDFVVFKGTCVELNRPHAVCKEPSEQVNLAPDGYTQVCTSAVEDSNKLLLRTISGTTRFKALKCPDGYKSAEDNECYPIATYEELNLDLEAPQDPFFW